MHLPSPTHHGYRMEGAHFSSIQQLRRSLSRSPSKPSRFQLRTSKPDTPGSPLSSLALARAFSPKVQKPPSPIAQVESPFVSQVPPSAKKKFSLRRAGPFRSSPRNRTAKSPRRALADSTTTGNTTPFASRPLFGEENMTPVPARKSSIDFWDNDNTDSQHFGIDDKPIKFEFARPQQMSSNAPGANCYNPTQPSPLKRRETNTGFDSASSNTPNPKRRSLHAGLPSGAELNLFESPAPRRSAEMPSQAQDDDFGLNFSSPNHMANMQSPRRMPSLRRAASQRTSTSAATPRPKQNMDGEFVKPMFAASKTRQRASLDGSSLYASSTPPESPFARPAPHLRGGAGNASRHPLANQLTPSSSTSNFGDMSHPEPYPAMSTPRVPNFSKSLPIGTARPTQDPEQPGDPPFATPYAAKLGHLVHPSQFAQSTGGLQSKKHRNVEDTINFVMPDTPIKPNDASKRASYPPSAGASPMAHRRSGLLSFGSLAAKQPEFGTPSTPFSSQLSKSSGSFGKGVGIFGSASSSHQRRGSFVSVDEDGDTGVDDNSTSPLSKHMMDSQDSADETPPTPTKPSDGSGRRSKESSLRRRTFAARSTRAAVSTDQFAAPESRGIDIPAATAALSRFAPRTPNESFMPPDPSSLSISGHRRGSDSFNSSIDSFRPPMTPTTPREHPQYFPNVSATKATVGVTKNDVDPALLERFHEVSKLPAAAGAFSEVFKVSKPVKVNFSRSSPPGSRVWIVKKAKKQYGGPRDRERRLREAEILKALRNSDHVVHYEDHFEVNNHLYIQTEYCENGNLATFLADEGWAGRIDFFRVWKLLLDLSMVSSTHF
jgi:mitosis inhibitor protein kinase SWE1